MKKIFGRPSGPAPLESGLASRIARLAALRAQVKSIVGDIDGRPAEQLRHRISVCLDATDLWLLRPDLHMVIARAHSEVVACERINSLIPHFAGWLPARQLQPIQPGGSTPA